MHKRVKRAKVKKTTNLIIYPFHATFIACLKHQSKESPKYFARGSSSRNEQHMQHRFNLVLLTHSTFPPKHHTTLGCWPQVLSHLRGLDDQAVPRRTHGDGATGHGRVSRLCQSHVQPCFHCECAICLPGIF